MELGNTIDLMNSKDYKDRFKAEYYQTKIRLEKLHRMLIKLEAETLDFRTSCPPHLLCEQEKYMKNYLRILEVRAEIEKVDLTEHNSNQGETA